MLRHPPGMPLRVWAKASQSARRARLATPPEAPRTSRRVPPLLDGGPRPRDGEHWLLAAAAYRCKSDRTSESSAWARLKSSAKPATRRDRSGASPKGSSFGAGSTRSSPRRATCRGAPRDHAMYKKPLNEELFRITTQHNHMRKHNIWSNTNILETSNLSTYRKSEYQFEHMKTHEKQG